MQAKGSFYVGRKTFITERFGADRWERFARTLAASDPAFDKPILVTSLIPIDAYARFQEACAQEFFGGDTQSYWDMGEAAAVWALTDGPYAVLAKGRDYKLLMTKLPLVWSMYFTSGVLETTAHEDPSRSEFKVTGNKLQHICVEYAVMGFARKAISMMDKPILETRKVRGVLEGDGSVFHYVFVHER